MHNPSIAEGQHEAAGADAHHDALRLEEARAGQSALVQGRGNADISVVQAGILSRLTQVEKALQGQASQMAAWQSEEEYGDVPHAGYPREVPQNEQHAVATGQHGRAGSAEVPQRSPVEWLLSRPQQMQPVLQASGAESGQFLAKLNYLKKLQLFHGNRPIPGQEQRSWQEWQGEFIQNARLCKLDADMYYHMAEALLSTHMREVWLTYLRVKPEDNTWAGLDTYMGIHYAALDKTVDAEKQFEGTKLLHGTEQAWQTYANAQAAHIADMGSSSERTRTDRGIWSLFLMNISTVLDVHATAFQAYMGSKEEHDALPVRARITKLTPLLQTYMKSKAVGQEQTTAAAPGFGKAARQTGGWKGSKRSIESLGRVQMQEQNTQEPNG